MERIVVALGGNALLHKGDPFSFEIQLDRATQAFENLYRLISENEVVITHGNGPQVGNILLQNEYSSKVANPMPLHSCGSMSQGLIGEVLTLAYDRVKFARGVSKEMAMILTRSVVNEADPAFKNPSKPVGSFYTEAEASRMKEERGWAVREEQGKGWRRIVPSPVPVDILEKSAILALLADGFLPVCTGGGGIPVVRHETSYFGADAVIDKDLASSVLATIIGAGSLMILTDVDGAYLNYGSPDQQHIGKVKLSELKEFRGRGEFSSGSMGPKIDAVIRFVEKGGKRALITSLENAHQGMKGQSGTIVVPD
ncbi:carbamate kinase [uncultured archaeon]|nr:carbamate kinase [uncultured archaeon]